MTGFYCTRLPTFCKHSSGLCCGTDKDTRSSMRGPALLLLQDTASRPNCPRHFLGTGFSGDKPLDSFAFLAEFDFYLKVVCLADIFFLISLSKTKTFISPDCSSDCSELFQDLYFCLTLTGEVSPHTSRKSHLIFKRFKLLDSFPLSFPAAIKLFINYSP